jgi:hypothetical protein
MIKKNRLPILAMAMICLLSGLWSGLSRIGWDVAALPIAAHHGAIMVGGFLGTLISLEKIIPLRKTILLGIPLVNAASLVFFFTGHVKLGICTLVISSAAMSLVFLYYLWSQRSVVYVLMMLGSLCWLTGNILLLTKQFYPLAFPWWLAFALFIIAAERLELMRFLPVTSADKKIFVGILITFVVGAVLSFHSFGNVICGIALAGASIWLLRNDLIGITIRKQNLQKYVALSLMTGYLALLLCGVFLLVLSDQWLNYDIVVHSFFIGFVFSMIFAHGPMILPGVLGIPGAPFHRILYIWLVLLHVSWLLRILADTLIEMEVRKLSGLLSAAAIVGYFITMAVLTIKSRRHATA